MVCTLPPYRFFLESLEPFSTLPDRIASILNIHKSILPFYYGQLFVSPKYLPLYSIRLETHYLSENQQNPQKLEKPIKVRNFDGTLNKIGSIMTTVDLTFHING